MKKRNLLFVLAILLVAALACDFSLGGWIASEPTATPEEEGSTLGEDPDSVDLDELQNLAQYGGDYTIEMMLHFEGERPDGTIVEGRVDTEGANRVEPPASRFTFTGSGDADLGGATSYEVVTIEEESYFWTNVAGCVRMPASQFTAPFNQLIDSGGVLGGIAQRVRPDVEVNGVMAFQFAITMDNLDMQDETSLDVREITEGNIFIARDGGYVLRIMLEGRAVSELLTGGDNSLEGDISYQLDFTPVDDVGEIVPPPGCEEGTPATESQFPVMPGATSVASFEGFLSYEVAADAQTVADFYKAEMAADGWTLLEENSLASVIALRFSMAGETVSVVIAFDAEAGTSSVVVGEEQ